MDMSHLPVGVGWKSQKVYLTHLPSELTWCQHCTTLAPIGVLSCDNEKPRVITYYKFHFSKTVLQRLLILPLGTSGLMDSLPRLSDNASLWYLSLIRRIFLSHPSHLLLGATTFRGNCLSGQLLFWDNCLLGQLHFGVTAFWGTCLFRVTAFWASTAFLGQLPFGATAFRGSRLLE